MLPIEALTEAKDKSLGSCVRPTCDLHGTTISPSHICKPEDPWEFPPSLGTLITLPDSDMLESSLPSTPHQTGVYVTFICASVWSNLHALAMSIFDHIMWGKFDLFVDLYILSPTRLSLYPSFSYSIRREWNPTTDFWPQTTVAYGPQFNSHLFYLFSSHY